MGIKKKHRVNHPVPLCGICSVWHMFLCHCLPSVKVENIYRMNHCLPPEGVSDDGRGEGGVKRLFLVLQQRAVPSSAEISNTKTGLPGQHELERFNKFRMIYKEEGKDKKQTS